MTKTTHSPSEASTQMVTSITTLLGTPGTSPTANNTTPPIDNSTIATTVTHLGPSPSPSPSAATDSTSAEISVATSPGVTMSFSHSVAPSTSRSPGTAEPDDKETPLSEKPGLVAIICIFLAIILIGAVVVLLKCYRGREPAFKKLDEVPMQGKVAEDSPFARYPPK
ncbi:uncharacterized LOC729966 homolog [Rhineura floridana]|uniref:uncharacterized LOC729966 homolog n=1 Tax=Rhineura floridana TaxID=261503 RepID=UPI002AC7EDBB|nr:uncharacterized LOC729966 homolog [Rhineura floridana]XP_061458011.1 uncharacterized LOC729966 homolog [Rhineura floridana]